LSHEREIAGVVSGAGALLLIYQGNVDAGVAILACMLGFFIGEQNGKKKTNT
jgi:hypothetical protein